MQASPCSQIDELLHAWVAGGIDGNNRSVLVAHLARCEACQEELARLYLVRQSFSDLLAESGPSEAQLNRIYANVLSNADAVEVAPPALTAVHDQAPGLEPQMLETVGALIDKIPPARWLGRWLQFATAEQPKIRPFAWGRW